MCRNVERYKEFLLYLRLEDGDVVAKRCTRICMSRRVVELFHELVVDIGEVVRELQRTVVCTVIWRGRQEIVWLSYTLEETL